MGNSRKMVACYEEVEHNWIYGPSSHSHGLSVSAYTVPYPQHAERLRTQLTPKVFVLIVMPHCVILCVIFKLESWYMVFVILIS